MSAQGPPKSNLEGRSNSNLSPSEIRCLALIAIGYSEVEIGQEFGRSANTISILIHSAMEKLHAKSRSHAVMLSLKFGLLNIDDLR